MRRFSQVDVFSAEPLLGNPVAVVHDADGAQRRARWRAFARWTNLSETTFLLAAHRAGRRLPAADLDARAASCRSPGHPTLGSAHAWLEAGGVPAAADEVVQECGAGLVRIRRGAAAAGWPSRRPPLLRSGPVADEDRARIAAALRIDASTSSSTPRGSTTGPAGSAVLLARRRRGAGARAGLRGVRRPQDRRGRARTPDGAPSRVEVRAFCPGCGMRRGPGDRVSLNAGIGQWLAGDRLPASYVAAQGTVLRPARPGARRASRAATSGSAARRATTDGRSVEVASSRRRR